MDQYELEGREQLIPKELYQWFLTPGIALLILAAFLRSYGYGRLKLPFFSRKSTPSLLLITVFSAFQLSEADAQTTWYQSTTEQIFDKPAEIRKGYAALQAANYSDAINHLSNARELSSGEEHAKLSLALAQAYYRAGDFSNARICYGDALLSSDQSIQTEARYNLSNALYKESTQALKPPNGMQFSSYLRAAIQGEQHEQNIGKLSNMQLDSIEKGLKTTLKQYREVLENDPSHAPSSRNLSSVAALLKLIQDTRKDISTEQQQQEDKEESQPEQKEDQDNTDTQDPQSGDKQDETPETDQDQQQQDQESAEQDGEQEGQQGDPKDTEDGRDSRKDSNNAENGEDGDKGNLAPTDQPGDQQTERQDMPDSEDQQQSSQQDPNSTDQIQKFKSKEEALEFLRRNQDSKKKPLDHYNSRFWRKTPRVDW